MTRSMSVIPDDEWIFHHKNKTSQRFRVTRITTYTESVTGRFHPVAVLKEVVSGEEFLFDPGGMVASAGWRLVSRNGKRLS
jgi:hypothetical protein